jgi:hypothetical protein
MPRTIAHAISKTRFCVNFSTANRFEISGLSACNILSLKFVCTECFFWRCFVQLADKTPSTRSDLSKEHCNASLSRRRTKINEKGETRLHVAARLNKQHDVVNLIADGADIDARDYAGQR